MSRSPSWSLALDEATPEPDGLALGGVLLQHGDRALHATAKRLLHAQGLDRGAHRHRRPGLQAGEVGEVRELAQILVAARKGGEQVAHTLDAEAPSVAPQRRHSGKAGATDGRAQVAGALPSVGGSGHALLDRDQQVVVRLAPVDDLYLDAEASQLDPSHREQRCHRYPRCRRSRA